MEPPCKICARLASSAAFNPRILESYKLPVTRRREHYDLRRCNAKVCTDLSSEFDSRSCNADCIIHRIHEVKRNVHELSASKRYDKGVQRDYMLEPSLRAGITNLRDAHEVVVNCLWEMRRVKAFLEDKNSWWKILKGRSVDCCKQKLPHLHGVLDGSSVTLMLLEEENHEIPRYFATGTSHDRSDNVGFKFKQTSSVEIRQKTSEIEYVKQYADPWKGYIEEYTDSYSVPSYTFETKSALMGVGSADRHEASQQYIKKSDRSSQNTVSSELRIKDRKGEQKISQSRSKETRDKIQVEDKETIVPPKEMWYGQDTQTTFELLRPRETFSRENIGNIKRMTIDFESNVDLNSDLPSRNVANHKPKTKTVTEKAVHHIQKLPMRILKHRSGN